MRTKAFQKALAVVAAGGLCLAALGASAQTSTATNSNPAPFLGHAEKDVLKLVQSRVSDDTVIAYVNSSPNQYFLSAGQILYLREQGVSDPVLAAMLNKMRQQPYAQPPAPQVAPTAPQPQTGTTAPYPAPAPAPDVTYAYPPQQPTVVYAQPAPQTYYYDPYYYYPSYGYYGWPYPYVGFSYGYGWRGGYWGGGWHGGGRPVTGYHGGFAPHVSAGFHGGFSGGSHGGGGGHR